MWPLLLVYGPPAAKSWRRARFGPWAVARRHLACMMYDLLTVRTII